MPTFYEVYQYYLQDPRAINLNAKRVKLLSHRIKNYYDKWRHATPLVYKEVEHNGEKINVRDYPSNFGNRMLKEIIQYCEAYKANCAKDLEQRAKGIEKRAKKEAEKPPVEKKKRQRKPVQKPAYSLKK